MFKYAFSLKMVGFSIDNIRVGEACIYLEAVLLILPTHPIVQQPVLSPYWDVLRDTLKRLS